MPGQLQRSEHMLEVAVADRQAIEMLSRAEGFRVRLLSYRTLCVLLAVSKRGTESMDRQASR